MMNLTFSDTEKPADLEKFQKITYPTFFFGFAIRTMYDQKRLKIKKEYNPNYIVHKYGNKADEIMFLYGMIAPVSNDVMPYILPLRANPNVNHEQYEAVLRPLEVECSDCYLFLAKNLYPINSFYTHRFFTKSNFKNKPCPKYIVTVYYQLDIHRIYYTLNIFLNALRIKGYF
jgi:hypothetical protein